MTIITTFSENYASARHRFLKLSQTLQWTVHSINLETTGPAGESLSIDVASSCDDEREDVIVLTSGLHGIEGFFGSAVQCAFLENASRLLNSDVKYVIIHALNPYGFAWNRRVNEDNIDLNRNFSTGEPFEKKSSESYARLNDLINPMHPPRCLDPFLLRAIFLIARFGMPALKQAIAAGQYRYPKGLFYGGEKPVKTQAILRDILNQNLHGSGRVIHFDFHTGLGRWGQCKLLIDYLINEEQRNWLIKHFGGDSFETPGATDTAYATAGSFGQWCIKQSFAESYLYLCAEFGTYSPFSVLRGLRAENQCHHWGLPNAKSTVRSKKRLKELFCPANADWRRMTTEKTLDLIGHAASAISTMSR